MAGKISEIATAGAPAQESDRFEATRDPTGTPATVWLDVGDLFDATRFNAQTGSTYTLAITDANGTVSMDNGSPNTVTIPTNASVAFPTGTIIEIVQDGAGATTVEASAGVTLNDTSAGTKTISAQFGVSRLVKVGTDAWIAELADVNIDKASAADIRAGTADKYITADGVESAAEEVTLTDGANIAVDWSTFINANVTLGGNRTLDLPSNGEPGTSRLIRVIQDATGSRLLTFAAGYKFPGGTAPTLSTAAGAVDVLEIYCVSTSEFYVFSALGMA